MEKPTQEVQPLVAGEQVLLKDWVSPEMQEVKLFSGDGSGPELSGFTS
ncbi:hypothetical protein GVN16_03605 [Emticicia sp. CRIBPO]|nr:hypothetical protein [Emticicia sp. CRIBPO]NBA84827.1 hypothetical protein [Emticicia sp. CRIBPO]